MIVPLSYPFTPASPLYPNTPPPVIQPLRSISRGDSANTSSITVSTHSGTHIDAPLHFCDRGASIRECFANPLSLFPVYCIDLPLQESREIMASDLDAAVSRAGDAAALLIRTGWGAVRSGNPGRYCTDHPWTDPDLPQFLRDACPGLRLFGIDQISVSSPLHREDGHASHRNFLCNTRPILLLEDLDLADCRLVPPFRIHIFPWFIDAVDGIPVTVIAER